MFQTKANKMYVKKYPFQTQKWNSMQGSKQKLINELMNLFVWYASKGSKHVYLELGEKYFLNLMCDVWNKAGKNASKHKKVWNDLTLIFYTKGSRKSLHFEEFLDLLPMISYHFEPELPHEDAMKTLLHYMCSIYEEELFPQINGRVLNVYMDVSDQTRQFISKLSVDLGKVYKLYFGHQISNKFQTNEVKFKSLSISEYFEFMKEFQVFPKLISARDLYYIFMEKSIIPPSSLIFGIQDTKPAIKEVGMFFTLSKFIQSLLSVSHRVYPKLINSQNEQQSEQSYVKQKQKLRTLLEYMETVKALSKKKKVRYTEHRFSFIVLDEHPELEATKTLLLKDKIIREPISQLDFYSLVDRIHF